MSFDDLMGDIVRIEKKDGVVLGPYKAAVDSTGAQIQLQEALIDDGDVMIRELPGNKEQRFIIEDAHFNKTPDSFGISSFYSLKISKEGKPQPGKESKFNVNIGTVRGPTMIGNSNLQQVQINVEGLIKHIDNSTATDSEKAEAKSLLKKLLEHPILAGVASGAILAGLGL